MPPQRERDDNDELEHDSTMGYPGEGPADGPPPGKLMSLTAYVLDPRTTGTASNVPPPADASVEQLRCYALEAEEQARSSLARATEDRKEADKAAERLHDAAQAQWPYVPPPAVHHPELIRLRFEEDFGDMGVHSVSNWSEEDSAQFRRKKQYRLEFIMAVVQCTEEIAAIALKGLLNRRDDDERGCNFAVYHAMLLHKIATAAATQEAAAVQEAANAEPRKHEHCNCYFACGCMYSIAEECDGQWQRVRMAAAKEAKDEVEAWEQAKLENTRLHDWIYGAWARDWRSAAKKAAEKKAAREERAAKKAARRAAAKAAQEAQATAPAAEAAAAEASAPAPEAAAAAATEAATEEAAAPMRFTVGQIVMFTGLIKRPDFNGQCGVVQAWDDEAQRYEVQVKLVSRPWDDEAQRYEVQVKLVSKKVQASNLVPGEPAAATEEASALEEPVRIPISNTTGHPLYNNMPLIELRKVAKNRGMPDNSNASRATLVQVLEWGDIQRAARDAESAARKAERAARRAKKKPAEEAEPSNDAIDARIERLMGTDNYMALAQALDMTLTSGQTEKAKEGQWNCTGCTFENKAFDVLCVMCEKPRYSDQWTCTKCSCRNPRTETECTACGPSGGNAQAGSRAVTRSAAEANREAEEAMNQESADKKMAIAIANREAEEETQRQRQADRQRQAENKEGRVSYP